MYHIVRMNESLEQIAKTYNLDIDEIKSSNQHIRDWEHLIAGTKLLLPSIPLVVKDELNDVEPFIEEYYPKITSYEEINEKIIEEEVNESKEVNKEVEKAPSKENNKAVNKAKHPKSSIFYGGYYPYNIYPNPYIYSYLRKKRNKPK